MALADVRRELRAGSAALRVRGLNVAARWCVARARRAPAAPRGRE
jgi:hypothetical protein